MRYYGANKGPLLGDIQFRDRVKRFVERLGDAFVSFGPHEQHLMMDKCIEEVGEEGPQACSEEYRKYSEAHKSNSTNFGSSNLGYRSKLLFTLSHAGISQSSCC